MEMSEFLAHIRKNILSIILFYKSFEEKQRQPFNFISRADIINKMHHPYLKEENKLWKKALKRVAGLDEAGRGPLAGPVMAAAVMVNAEKIGKCQNDFLQILKEINDSKKLSPRKREKLYNLIVKCPAIEWGTGKVSEKVIDKINILQASKLAMEKAVNKILKKQKKLDFLIIDGNFKINSPFPQKPIIKADEKVFSCMASSIIAKVSRDRIMVKLHKKYPHYGFHQHKGYPTKYHCKMLKKYKICSVHRKSFRPVSQMA